MKKKTMIIGIIIIIVIASIFYFLATKRCYGNEKGFKKIICPDFSPRLIVPEPICYPNENEKELNFICIEEEIPCGTPGSLAENYSISRGFCSKSDLICCLKE